MAHERKCAVCGRKYRYCPRCDEFKNMPTWMLEFDSENCRKIYYDIVNPFAFKHITKEEASERLEACDLSGIDSFKAEIKSVIDRLVSDPAPAPAADRTKKETSKKRLLYKPAKED